MGSEKSPLNSSDSSWARAFRAITTDREGIVSGISSRWENVLRWTFDRER